MDYIPGANRRKEEDHEKSLACQYSRSEEIACQRLVGCNRKSRSHDYTVIIKWKDWCAFEEDKDLGIDALKRKRKETVNLQDHKVESEMIKPALESTLIDQAKKSMPIPSSENKTVICVPCDPIDIKLSDQLNSRYSQAGAEHTQSVQSTLSYDVDEATMKDQQEEETESSTKKLSISVIKSISNPDSNLSRSCSLEDSNACSDGSEQIHPSTCASDASAQAVDHACAMQTACKSSLKAKPGEALLKSFTVEEAYDAIVVLDGKVKMCDIKTIYEKSPVVNKQSQRDDAKMMQVQELRIVDYERRTKRLKETAGPSGVHRGALVKCPVCGLTIPGDIHDADFNNQINLHVDACIGFSNRH